MKAGIEAKNIKLKVENDGFLNIRIKNKMLAAKASIAEVSKLESVLPIL
jgi:hypothetical protein